MKIAALMRHSAITLALAVRSMKHVDIVSMVAMGLNGKMVGERFGFTVSTGNMLESPAVHATSVIFFLHDTDVLFLIVLFLVHSIISYSSHMLRLHLSPISA